MKSCDIAILGAGPGGYVAAIKASQLGKKVIIIEKDRLGGVCLNRGCIPTKALLKSAHTVHEISSMKDLGIEVELKSKNSAQAVKRANAIADRVSKGVEFLMKKNSIEVVSGAGRLIAKNKIQVTLSDASNIDIEASSIIIATGAHYKTFPGLEHDGKRLIGAWEALKLEELPKTMAIIGAGAIGIEFAYFWNAFGVDVHIFELQKNLLPLEDRDSSTEIERAFKKLKIKQTLGVSKVNAKNNGDDVTISLEKDGVANELKFEKCLIAVGMTGNIDGIGLDDVGIETQKGFIKIDQNYKTTVDGIYAIGDVSGPPLLAHVASHEGILAVEHICGHTIHPIDKTTIPACTYCQPQVASVGKTEDQLKIEGVEYKVGKMFFRANGKAIASNETDGLVKVLLSADGKLLGAHLVGNVATELIHELALFKNLGVDAQKMFDTIHPHPTLGEWIPEAFMDAYKKALHA